MPARTCSMSLCAAPEMRRRTFAAFMAAGALLGACGREATPERLDSVPAADRAYGADQHPRLLAEFGGAYAGPESRYVADLGEKIARGAGLGGQCTFTLVNTDVVNAFAVPGCYIYVTRGLFAIVTSEAELASVLGHEIGHIVGAHSRRQERRSLWRTLGVIAVSLTGSEQLTRLAGQAAQYFTLRYSRGQEYESDELGIRYLHAAGYDPHAAPDMLAALGRHDQFMTTTSGRDEASAIPEWARSHPLTENRISRAREIASGLAAPDALPENEAAYLDEVDGLLFGDDPEQGFVLGRRFAHPIMRIAFDAPEGFTLTNSPQAILLAGPQGLRGEFGGGALPGGRLDIYIQQLVRQIAGDAAGQGQAVPAMINGMRALLVTLNLSGAEGVVPVSIAAYDAGDGQAYHFLVASPAARPSLEAVSALFRSFRRLSDAEVGQLRPRVVRTVAVGPQVSPAAIINRIADPHPQALFAMMNDRPATRPFQPGERVKIVTYASGR